MKIGISLKIDVTKIDKARLFKGEKGLYLDCTAFIDVEAQDQYGNNGFIAQSVSKEEREQGQQGAILGNTKVFYKDAGSGARQPQADQSEAPQQQSQGLDDFDDDIPF